jgi:hypothetical protein
MSRYKSAFIGRDQFQKLMKQSVVGVPVIGGQFVGEVRINPEHRWYALFVDLDAPKMVESDKPIAFSMGGHFVGGLPGVPDNPLFPGMATSIVLMRDTKAFPMTEQAETVSKPIGSFPSLDLGKSIRAARKVAK